MSDKIYTETLKLDGIKETNKVALCCAVIHDIKGHTNYFAYLHEEEYKYWMSFKHKKRQNSYLLGRIVGKRAVAMLSKQKKLSDIIIKAGIFHQPIVISDEKNIQISITHCNHIGAALAFPESCPMGIDIEKIEICKAEILRKQMTDNEIEQIFFNEIPEKIGLTLLWTAKEALSKILKTGLTTPLFVFEISRMRREIQGIRCYYKNFSQYQSISFIFHNYVCSVVYPVSLNLHFDINSFQQFILNQAE